MQGPILQRASGFLNRRWIESVFVEKLYIPFHHWVEEREREELGSWERVLWNGWIRGKVQWGSALAAGRLDLAIKQGGTGPTEYVVPQSNWEIYCGSDKRKERGCSWAYSGHGVSWALIALTNSECDHIEMAQIYLAILTFLHIKQITVPLIQKLFFYLPYS